MLAGDLQRGTADGPGAIARFDRPNGLSLLERFDAEGNSPLELYIADFVMRRNGTLPLESY